MSVRGGGHAFAGFGTNDGGVVIDLGALASVEVTDKERHLVRIGGGATWGQVATALAPHGLAISSGDTKGVGVGGLTLSGGHRLEGQEARPGPGQPGRRGAGHRRWGDRAGLRAGEPGAVLGDPRRRRQLRDRDRLRVRGTPDDGRLLRPDRLPRAGGGGRAPGLGGPPPHRP
ncbi:FAD-binding protein [Nonomuraea ferruginea]